jgi:hypothetical protein
MSMPDNIRPLVRRSFSLDGVLRLSESNSH